jgi:valyl-tRNA synthetase
LEKRYDAGVVEPRLERFWEELGVYHYHRLAPPDRPEHINEAENGSHGRDGGNVYSIDTPPPTVSGFLHLGHVYSYSHPDFVARFRRMRGDNVYYPMGFDDNGLPTERLVERLTGQTAEEIGRAAFIAACLETSREYEQEYETLWRRLGLSIDWRYTYRTIDDDSRTTAQQTFLDLYHKDLAYRRQAPTIWCTTCHTAIAQAEEKDLDRRSEFVTLAFHLGDGSTLPIATTRPELLAACVAVFVHPGDERYRDLVGKEAEVPLFHHRVPILEDPHADPEKGTGAVMCCTFGDTVDVEWWYTHHLPLREAIDRRGRLTAVAGPFEGMTVEEGRRATIEALEKRGELLDRQPIEQSVRVHERCDTPVEYIVTRQWFVRVLDHKEVFLRIGDGLRWRPEHMRARYREWVEGLHWDWCISRQRYYGVPIPVWYCTECDAVLLPDESQLPLDPTVESPPTPCSCGSTAFTPEADVLDTWATSSCSPQIAGRSLAEPALYAEVFPMSVRPQAHEIIRTWAFYTIVMSHYRFGAVPWREVLISGWGLAPGDTEKISKSRGGGPMAPLEMLERYSADAARYWAASTGLGKDAVISEEKIAAGAKLVTKLWNVARFAERFIAGYEPPPASRFQAENAPTLSSADRWILSRTQRLIRSATAAFEEYEYATAKNDVEQFFWTELSDNYLEMAKKRLYDEAGAGHAAARYTLHRLLHTIVLLFAPILPYVTEEIYQALFRREIPSVHRVPWPQADDGLIDSGAEAAGFCLVAVATAVRRYKSDHALSLGAELDRIHLQVAEIALLEALRDAEDDISGVTRAREVLIDHTAEEGDEGIALEVGGSEAVEVRVVV